MSTGPGKNRRIRWLRMLQMYEQVRGICPDCEKPMDLRFSFAETRRRSNEATIEHRVPRQFGGTDAWSNIQLLCASCNNKRGEILNAQIPGHQDHTGQKPRPIDIGAATWMAS